MLTPAHMMFHSFDQILRRKDDPLGFPGLCVCDSYCLDARVTCHGEGEKQRKGGGGSRMTIEFNRVLRVICNDLKERDFAFEDPDM